MGTDPVEQVLERIREHLSFVGYSLSQKEKALYAVHPKRPNLINISSGKVSFFTPSTPANPGI